MTAWRIDMASWRPTAVALLLMLAGCGDSSSSGNHAAASAPADSTARYQTGDAARDRLNASAIKALPPAPKPAEALAPDTSCVTAECHTRFIASDYVHGPVGAGRCDACHDRDTGGHVYPLLRAERETCTFCHQVSGTLEHQHEPASGGRCVACHDPHVSNVKFLLTEPTVDRLCARCHEVVPQKFAHDPFADGRCDLCHRAHQSTASFLLRGGEGPDHCFSCHDDLRQNMAAAPRVHSPAAENCTTCHNAHTSSHPYQLNQSIEDTCFSCHEDMATRVRSATVTHGALLDAKQCANCHDAHASDREAFLKDRTDQLCMQCHDKPAKGHDGRIVASMTNDLKQPYLHGPIKSGDCSACHNAHGSNNSRLLVEGFPDTFYTSFNLTDYALCFRCHDAHLVLDEKSDTLTGFRNGDMNLHYLHVHRDEKGRTCKTCHAIHGSSLPNHIAASVPFEGSNWPMPIGYQKSDTGGSCSPGCHEPKRYDRNVASPTGSTGGSS